MGAVFADWKLVRSDQQFRSFSQIAQFSPERGICHRQLEPLDNSSLGWRRPLLPPIFTSQQGQMFIRSSFPPSNIISVSAQAPLARSTELLSALTFKRCVVCVCVQTLGQTNELSGSAKEVMTECEAMRLISISRLFSALKTDN